MERERVVNTLIISTNGVRKNRPDGVTNVIFDSKRCLQGRTILDDRAMVVEVGGPRIPDEENNIADFNLGMRARAPKMNGTHFEASILYRGKPKARKFLEEKDPDLVVVHNPLAGNVMHSLMSADKEGKICFVGYFHAQAETLDAPSQIFHFFSRLRRPTFNSSTLVGLTQGFKNTIDSRLDGRIAVSRAAGEFWDRLLPGDYEIIYNGIDTNRFKPGEIKEESQNGKKTIFAAARFDDERKGLDVLLPAVRILIYDYNMDVEVRLAGKFEKKDELKVLNPELGLGDYIKLLGFLSPEALDEEYRNADVFTSPVLGGEAFGLTLAEAMASGTLVVGSNVAGYNEVIGGNLPFAFLTKPGDPKDVADKLKNVLDLDSQERRNRGKLAREYVEENFSLTKNIDHQASYYERCLGARSAKVAERKRKHFAPPAIPSRGDIFVK